MIGVELLYELKRIFRNNIFKLFMLFSIVGIITIQYTWINFTMLHVPFVRWYYFWLPWSYKGLPFAIPCMNAFLFNLVQVLFVVFIYANDLRIRGKGTMEALYVRPVSNVQILIGRSIGKLISISLFNLIALGIALFSNLMYSDYAFNGLLYLFYWITLTFPTLVFILGLSSLLKQIIKHQGLFILFVLCILGTIVLLFTDYRDGILDPLAREIPNVFSDVTGHADMVNYMLQRFTILLTGMVFIVFAMVFYPRLENLIHTRKRMGVAGCFLLLIAMVPAGIFVHCHHVKRESQEYYKSLQDNCRHNLVDHLVVQEISLQEEKKGFRAECRMQITRLAHSDSSLVLFLNPALEVDNLERNGIPVIYARCGQVLTTDLHLEKGDTVDLYVAYHGCVDGSVIYPDLPGEEQHRIMTSRIGVYRLGAQSMFDLEYYKLYPPESLWYPTCVIPSRSSLYVKDFTRYSLSVQHQEGTTVISQGIPERFRNGKTIFNHTHALPGISLCIGNYSWKTITVDSTRYDVYYFPEHEYLFKGFGKVTESFAGEQIREIKQQLEYVEGTPSEDLLFQRKRDKKYDRIQRYPYQWLYLIETPISLYFFRGDKVEGEREYGGLVFLPESIITCDNFDFQDQGDQINEPRFSTQLHLLLGMPHSGLLTSGSCSINSTMCGNTCFIFSEKYPFIHEAISLVCKDMGLLLQTTIDDDRKMEVINYLSRHSLRDAVESKLSPLFIKDILCLKVAELKALIASRVDFNEFEIFYRDFLFRHLFEGVLLDDFVQEAENNIHLKLMPVLDGWYTSNRLASFVIKDYYKIYSDACHKNLYSFKVFNQGEAEGTIIADDNQVWHISPGEAVEIKAWRHEEPYVIKPAYLAMPLSCNLPDILYLTSGTSSFRSDTLARIINISPREFDPDSNEIIVDNEDAGFKIIENDVWRKVFSFKGREKEIRYGYEYRSDRWSLLVDQKYFGNPVRSALVIGIGKGNHKVEWSASLPREGEYEIFYHYVPETEYSKEILADERNFIIDDGTREHELKLELDPDNRGWVSLGVFHFEKSRSAKVILSDKGNVNRYMRLSFKKTLPKIVADAVKWKRVYNK